MIENCARFAGMPVGPAGAERRGRDRPLAGRSWTRRGATPRRPARSSRAAGTEDMLELMVKKLERFGRKNGKGFYDYPADGKKRLWPELAEALPGRSQAALRRGRGEARQGDRDQEAPALRPGGRHRALPRGQRADRPAGRRCRLDHGPGLRAADRRRDQPDRPGRHQDSSSPNATSSPRSTARSSRCPSCCATWPPRARASTATTIRRRRRSAALRHPEAAGRGAFNGHTKGPSLRSEMTAGPSIRMLARATIASDENRRNCTWTPRKSPPSPRSIADARRNRKVDGLRRARPAACPRPTPTRCSSRCTTLRRRRRQDGRLEGGADPALAVRAAEALRPGLRRHLPERHPPERRGVREGLADQARHRARDGGAHRRRTRRHGAPYTADTHPQPSSPTSIAAWSWSTTATYLRRGLNPPSPAAPTRPARTACRLSS